MKMGAAFSSTVVARRTMCSSLMNQNCVSPVPCDSLYRTIGQIRPNDVEGRPDEDGLALFVDGCCAPHDVLILHEPELRLACLMLYKRSGRDSSQRCGRAARSKMGLPFSSTVVPRRTMCSSFMNQNCVSRVLSLCHTIWSRFVPTMWKGGPMKMGLPFSSTVVPRRTMCSSFMNQNCVRASLRCATRFGRDSSQPCGGRPDEDGLALFVDGCSTPHDVLILHEPELRLACLIVLPN